ncbi:MAG: hypothetical protein RSA79_00815 [Oscillospiraceae bacterium]
MIFKSKLDRLVNMKSAQKNEEDLKNSLKNEPLEKNDIKAMILSAIIVFLPVTLVIISVFAFFVWLIFLL